MSTEMKENDVIFVRLRHTMEEIIAKYAGEDDHNVILENPTTLTRVPPSGQLGLIPWCILRSEREIPVRHSDILVKGLVPKSMHDAYIEFTSGITIAHGSVEPKSKSGIIMG